jgi:hypothetical protein
MDRLSIAILRPGGIYGPRDLEFLPVFQSVKAGLLTRFGLFPGKMNLCHVQDVARAVLLAGILPEADSETFLVSGTNTDQVELGKVLVKTQEILTQPLDLLGMDACLMSNLEVAYQAAPYVKYIVASEESEPNEGWPYQLVLSELVAHPDMPTADFASHIVRAYVQSYQDMGYAGDVTQSAFDLGQIAPLNSALDHLADAWIERLPRAASQIWKAQRKSKRFWHNTLADIGSLGAEMKKTTRSTKTRQAIAEVAAALQSGAGQFVIAEAHDGAGVAACSGVTVYLPSPLSGISRYYGDLDFAGKQRWLKMLRAYHAA